MKQIMWKHISVYQIVITAFLLSVLPLFVIFIALIYASYDSNRQSVLKAIEVECETVVQDIDRGIESIYLRQFELLSNEDVIALSHPKTSLTHSYEWGKNVKRVLTTLNAVTTFNDYIETLSIYYPQRGFYLACDRGVNYHTLNAEKNQWLKEISAAIHGVVRDGAPGSMMIVTSSAARGVSQADSAVTLPQILIVSTISIKALRYDMAKYADSSPEKEFILCSKDYSTAVTSTLPDAELHPALDALRAQPEISQINISGELATVFRMESKQTNWMLIGAMRETVAFARIDRLRNSIPAITVYMITIACGFLLLIYYALSRPMQKLCKALTRIGAHDFAVVLEGGTTRDMRIVYDRFNGMASDLNRLIDREYKQTILLKDAELKQLQLQISPHFLYNTFFILRSFLEEEAYDSAAQLAQLLGMYLRYITKNKNPQATLWEEDEHARAYASIQQLRFLRRLTIDIQPLPVEWENVIVPRLILQPLMENAFLYGVNDARMGQIRIAYESGGAWRRIIVEDSGFGDPDTGLTRIRAALKGEGEGGSGIALYNIHTRLGLMFGGRSGLYAERSALGGIRMVIHIEGGSPE